MNIDQRNKIINIIKDGFKVTDFFTCDIKNVLPSFNLIATSDIYTNYGNDSSRLHNVENMLDEVFELELSGITCGYIRLPGFLDFIYDKDNISAINRSTAFVDIDEIKKTNEPLIYNDYKEENGKKYLRVSRLSEDSIFADKELVQEIRRI